MIKLALLALLLFAPAGETAQHNDRSIATARAAVRDMMRAAETPEEKALAEKDRQLVEQAAELLSKRAAMKGSDKQMEEAQMSFNLQYLRLQEKMQNENRNYTAVSNIMRTKHDTVKNSISNIR
jgi:hypothetical protein